MSVAVDSGLRGRLGGFIENRTTQRLIIALILINGVILGLETSPALMDQVGPWLIGADRLILSVFVVEILIKLFVQRAAFFRQPWNVFDFLVVSIALIPTSGPLAVLRILRLLRLVSMVPKLRFIVEALLKAVPGILSIFGLLILLFYVFAVIATGLFGQQYPEWFGHLGRSMYTLFQVMTLESWSMGISRPVMETFPWAWVFFVPFILVATFTILNLFIAIIVNTMQTLAVEQQEFEQETIEKVVHNESEQLHDDLKALHREISALRAEIKQLKSGQN
ncbi:voltage-gated sodium channel [Ectothiorhodosinus mongolicus]|uniref:Voltage-gated sodium channel n=1 Tax=Ectothiorhodosinus mongolicus TaxID=233100 RepID=A0A1R3VM67_9GAMM|nr:ion transporter [Ectothiorhodosinus mongolicus]ULX57812.1 ion transporter [Ectothiorhodosinus mongolicus]SIT65680.1 voltage-gated sodium channel [Ectothiorhodosinus mongolicus]